MKNRLHVSVLLSSCVLLAACGDGTKFGGNTGATQSADATPAPDAPPPAPAPAAIPPPPTKSLSLTCPSGGTGQAHLETSLASAKGTKVQLQGQFCNVTAAAAASSLTVAFIIDWSGSMSVNDPDNNGACGRLTAVQTILTWVVTER